MTVALASRKFRDSIVSASATLDSLFWRVAQVGPTSNARHALTDKGSTPSHHALVIPAPGQTFDSATKPRVSNHLSPSDGNRNLMLLLPLLAGVSTVVLLNNGPGEAGRGTLQMGLICCRTPCQPASLRSNLPQRHQLPLVMPNTQDAIRAALALHHREILALVEVSMLRVLVCDYYARQPRKTSMPRAPPLAVAPSRRAPTAVLAAEPPDTTMSERMAA